MQNGARRRHFAAGTEDCHRTLRRRLSGRHRKQLFELVLCNLGLLPFIRERPNEVRNYMNVYIRNVDRSNYTTNDIKFGGDANLPIACPADSNDSYASSFLSLASEYLKVTGDVAWVCRILCRILCRGLLRLRRHASSFQRQRRRRPALFRRPGCIRVDPDARGAAHARQPHLVGVPLRVI